MFSNIGEKIKVFSTLLSVLGIIVSVIAGLVLIANEVAVVGCLVLIVGPRFSWLGSLFAYGLGQLSENTDVLAGKKRAETASPAHRSAPAAEPVPVAEFVPRSAPAPAAKPAVLQEEEKDVLEMVDVSCPFCKSSLSYPTDALAESSVVRCPICDEDFIARRNSGF